MEPPTSYKPSSIPLNAGPHYTFAPDRTHFGLYRAGDDHTALMNQIAAEMYAEARSQEKSKWWSNCSQRPTNNLELSQINPQPANPTPSSQPEVGSGTLEGGTPEGGTSMYPTTSPASLIPNAHVDSAPGKLSSVRTPLA